MNTKLDPSLAEFLDNKFKELKAEISTDNKLSADRLVKRLKSDHVFKKKGCEDQYKFNSAVQCKIEEACVNLEKGDLDKVHQLLHEGNEAIGARNKLVKLADKSEGGWATVSEYVDNDLADNSDDDKKIRRAEAAVRGAKKRKRETFLKKKSYTHNFSAQSGNSNFAFNGRPRGPQPSDTCMQCGLFGHWRKDCQQRTAAGYRKSYNPAELQSSYVPPVRAQIP
jgi:hypothetical protein